MPLKDGLKTEAAMEMNLLPNTPVAAALIDAHCGKNVLYCVYFNHLKLN